MSVLDQTVQYFYADSSPSHFAGSQKIHYDAQTITHQNEHASEEYLRFDETGYFEREKRHFVSILS